MSERIHGLAHLLPGKTSLDDCSLEELQHLAKRYPYFAPAQFLLLQKLKEAGSPEATIQQQKAVLYHHDPLQFEFFMAADRYYMDEAVIWQPSNQAAANALPHTENSFSPITTNTQDTTLVAAEPQAADLVMQEESVRFSEPDKTEKNDTVEIAEPAVLPVPPLHEVLQPSATPILFAHTAPEPVNEANNLPVPSQAPPPNEEKIAATITTRNPVEIKEPVTGSIDLPQVKTSDQAPVFEPYHMVDYFASQGIKITTEELPKDKLSTQLRSFTDWLKIMKRLPAAELEKTPQTPAEKTVENMASHSVEESDVVTEAMAEVWAKQGNRRKAIETYNKLSLQNPSKRAYFAAKIENLSGS